MQLRKTRKIISQNSKVSHIRDSFHCKNNCLQNLCYRNNGVNLTALVNLSAFKGLTGTKHHKMQPLKLFSQSSNASEVISADRPAFIIVDDKGNDFFQQF